MKHEEGHEPGQHDGIDDGEDGPPPTHFAAQCGDGGHAGEVEQHEDEEGVGLDG